MFSQSEYSGEEDILTIEGVIGYRQWGYSHAGLVSMKPADWSTGKLHARCERMLFEQNFKEHKSPEISCYCGIYAHYLPLESYTRNYPAVFGVIEASGKILMGTKGFRAEKAKILALGGYGHHNEWFEVSIPEQSRYARESLLEFCDSIGVYYFDDVEEMIHQFPQVDLTSLGVPDLSKWEEDRAFAKRHKEQIEYEIKMRNTDLDFAMTQYGYDKQSWQYERMRSTMDALGGFTWTSVK